MSYLLPGHPEVLLGGGGPRGQAHEGAALLQEALQEVALGQQEVVLERAQVAAHVRMHHQQLGHTNRILRFFSVTKSIAKGERLCIRANQKDSSQITKERTETS